MIIVGRDSYVSSVINTDEAEGSESPFTLLWEQEKNMESTAFHWEPSPENQGIIFSSIQNPPSDLRSVYFKNVMTYRVKCYVKLSDATVKEYVIIYIL